MRMIFLYLAINLAASDAKFSNESSSEEKLEFNLSRFGSSSEFLGSVLNKEDDFDIKHQNRLLASRQINLYTLICRDLSKYDYDASVGKVAVNSAGSYIVPVRKRDMIYIQTYSQNGILSSTIYSMSTPYTDEGVTVTALNSDQYLVSHNYDLDSQFHIVKNRFFSSFCSYYTGFYWNSDWNPRVATDGINGYIYFVGIENKNYVYLYRLRNYVNPWSSCEVTYYTLSEDNTCEYSNHDIVYQNNYNYITCWTQRSLSQSNIYFQPSSYSGSKLGSNTKVSLDSSKKYDYSRIANLTDRGFVISWREVNNSAGNLVYFQRFYSNYQFYGSNTVVNTILINSASTNFQDVIGLFGGGFVIAWLDTTLGGKVRILFQVYDTLNNLVGSNKELQFDGDVDPSYPIDMISMNDGGFMITWTGRTSGLDIQNYGNTRRAGYLQRFTAQGDIYAPKYSSAYMMSQAIGFDSYSPINPDQTCNFTTITKDLGLSYSITNVYDIDNSTYAVEFGPDKKVGFYTNADSVINMRVLATKDCISGATPIKSRGILTYCATNVNKATFDFYSISLVQLYGFQSSIYFVKKVLQFESLNVGVFGTSGSNVVYEKYELQGNSLILTKSMGILIPNRAVNFFRVSALTFGGFIYTCFNSSNNNLEFYQFDEDGNLLNQNTTLACAIAELSLAPLENGGVAVAYECGTSPYNLSYFTLNGFMERTSDTTAVVGVKEFTLGKMTSGFVLVYRLDAELFYTYRNLYNQEIQPGISVYDIKNNARTRFSIRADQYDNLIVYYFSTTLISKLNLTIDCISNYYVQSQQKVSTSCKGSIDDPCDSIWLLLTSIPQDKAVKVKLLKNSLLDHYLLPTELDDSGNVRFQSNYPKSIKSVFLEPYYCNDPTLASYPAMINNCSDFNEKLKIFVKSDFRLLTFNLTLSNIILDGIENIGWINFDTSFISTLNQCINKRVRCCSETDIMSPISPTLYCKRSIPIQTFVDQGNSYFSASINLIVKFSEFRNLQTLKSSSLFSSDGASSVLQFSDIIIDQILFYKGLLTVYGSSSIIVTNVAFTNYNPSALSSDQLGSDEGFFIQSSGTVTISIEDSSFDSASFKYTGCPQSINISSSFSDMRSRLANLPSISSSLININSANSIIIRRSSFKRIMGSVGSIISVKICRSDCKFHIISSIFENTFASSAFSTIYLNINGSESAKRNSEIIIIDSQFSGGLGCGDTFGNILISYDGFELGYGTGSIQIHNNLFKNNYLPLSNSIAFLSAERVTITSNQFIDNYYKPESYSILAKNFIFAGKYSLIQNSSLILKETTVLYFDYAYELNFDGNIFKNNSIRLRNSLCLADFLTIKNWDTDSTLKFYNEDYIGGNSGSSFLISLSRLEGIQSKASIVFENITVYDHQGSSIYSTIDSRLASLYDSKIKYESFFIRFLGEYDLVDDLNQTYFSSSSNVQLEIIFNSVLFEKIAFEGANTALLSGDFSGHILLQQSMIKNLQGLKIMNFPSLDLKIVFNSINIQAISYTSAVTEALFSGSSSYEFGECTFIDLALTKTKLFELGEESVSAKFANVKFENVAIDNGLTTLYLFDFDSNEISFVNSSFIQTTNLIQTTSNSVLMSRITISTSYINPSVSFLIDSQSRFSVYSLNKISLRPFNAVPAFLKIMSGKASYLSLTDSYFDFSNSISGITIKLTIEYIYLIGNVFINKAMTKQTYTLLQINNAQDIAIHRNTFQSPSFLLNLFSSSGSIAFYSNNIILNQIGNLISILQSNSIQFNMKSNQILTKSNLSESSYPTQLISINDQSLPINITKNIFMECLSSQAILNILATIKPVYLTFTSNTFMKNLGSPLAVISSLSEDTSSTIARIESNVFIKNKNLDLTRGMGGAIYLNSPDYSYQTFYIYSNYFVKNQARTAGGAIYFNWNPPLFDDKNYFSQNQAFDKINHIYGFPVRFVWMDDTTKLLTNHTPKYSDSKSYSKSLKVQNISDFPSGIDTTRSYSFALLDVFDQLQFGDSSSTLTVNLLTKNNNLSFSSLTTKAQAVNGIYTFAYLNFKFNHLYQLEIAFNSSAINTKYFNNILNTTLNNGLPFRILFRECINGEYLLEDNTCSSCLASFWLPSEYNNNKGPCGLCESEKMICRGGVNYGPRSGYWILNATASIVVDCPHPYACLGNKETDSNLTYHGQCALGYQGNLCNTCDKNYGKIGSGRNCEDCGGNLSGPYTEISFNMILLLLIVFGLIINQFKLDELEIKMVVTRRKIKNLINFVKILINYSHTMYFIRNLNINWPVNLYYFISVLGNAFNGMLSIFTNECWIQSQNPNTRIAFFKFLATQLSPFIVSAALIVPLVIYSIIKGLENEEIKVGIFMLISIVFYIFYPVVLMNSLSLFKCFNIYRYDNPKYYLEMDYDIKCWGEEHKNYAIDKNIPFILIWVILIPFLVFLISKKSRRSESTKLKFYFLVSDLRNGKVYWELVNIIKKIMFAVVIVFGSFISTFSQIFLFFLLMIVFTVAQMVSAPNKSVFVNRLNTVAFISSLNVGLALIYLEVVDITSDLLASYITKLVYLGFAFFMIVWLLHFIRLFVNISLIRRNKRKELLNLNGSKNKKLQNRKPSITVDKPDESTVDKEIDDKLEISINENEKPTSLDNLDGNSDLKTNIEVDKDRSQSLFDGNLNLPFKEKKLEKSKTERKRILDDKSRKFKRPSSKRKRTSPV